MNFIISLRSLRLAGWMAGWMICVMQPSEFRKFKKFTGNSRKFIGNSRKFKGKSKISYTTYEFPLNFLEFPVNFMNFLISLLSLRLAGWMAGWLLNISSLCMFSDEQRIL